MWPGFFVQSCQTFRLVNYGQGNHYYVRSDTSTVLTEFVGTVKDKSGNPVTNAPIQIVVRRNNTAIQGSNCVFSNGQFYADSFICVDMYNPTLSTLQPDGYQYWFVMASVEIYCGNKYLGGDVFYILRTDLGAVRY